MACEFSVENMVCGACVAHVEKACLSVEGVTKASANLLTGKVTVEGDGFDIELVKKAVEGAGYIISNNNQNSNKKKQISDKSNVWKIISIACSFLLSFVIMFVPDIWKLVLSTVVLAINYRFFVSGGKALLKLSPTMDSLVAMGSFVSYGYSLFLLIKNQGGMLYFDSAAMILAFISIGKFIESLAKNRAKNALEELLSLEPQDDNIAVGDILEVFPGDKIKADGVIVEGGGDIDESMQSGEELPVFKTKDDNVFAGTINTNGHFKMRATAVKSETLLSKTIKAMEKMQAEKAPVARIADKAASIFVPFVFGVALVTFFAWLIINGDVASAVSRGVCVLVISCPCAMGLATPVAIICASSNAAKHGILFKTAEAMENCGKAKSVAFDKTGTITKPHLSVVKYEIFGENTEKELLETALACESGSLHPAAIAIKNFASEKGVELQKNPEEIKTYPGKGMAATFESSVLLAGTPDFAFPESFEFLPESHGTYVCVSKNDRPMGFFVLKSELKAGATDTLRKIKALGIKTLLLTGDSQESCDEIQKLNIFDDIKSRLLPIDKSEIVGKEPVPSVMCGDGINDSLALTAATVGIAMGEGTDAAKAAGNVIISGNEPERVYDAIMLCRKTIKIIYENLLWAVFYNLLGIPLAAGVFGFMLPPMFGALAMSFSSFFVVSNSLRLLKFKWTKIKNKQNKEENKTMNELKINVTGMMCHNCERHVNNAVLAVLPGAEVTSDFEKNLTVVRAKVEIPTDKILAAIKEEGYECKIEG